jgi:hypothetical protein
MENLCHFVNSRGILKSCDFHSSDPKSSCNDDKGYLLEMLNRMFDGMSIYVCSDLLKFFVTDILSKINKKFVLVSGDSDLCVPKEILSLRETHMLLNSPYLIKWFLQNTQIQNNSKMVQMPIGLDYHTISNNPDHSWKIPNESHLPGAQELILVNIKEKSQPYYDRIPKIYVNFSKTNDRFKDRVNSLNGIPNKLMIFNETFTKRTINWNLMSKYAFVLSPFGNGMDCHRTWEALCLGCIPIVCAPNFTKLFEELPVLNVNDWKEVTEELLKATIIKFKNSTFNLDKLLLSSWVNQIKNMK